MNMYSTHRGAVGNPKSYSSDASPTHATAKSRSCTIPVLFSLSTSRARSATLGLGSSSGVFAVSESGMG